MKKSAFTLVESLVSVLIISAVGMAALVFSSAYLKTTFERDMQMKSVMSNVSTVEKLRAEVKTLPQLYEFSQGKEIKISAVGIGEIELNADGSFTVINAESNSISPSLMPKTANAFKIDVGGSAPNTKITTVVILN